LNFKPNEKLEHPHLHGVPEFEPNLKAGTTWQSQLYVPQSVRKSAGNASSHSQHQNDEDGEAESVTWIVEVASQVIFSNSAKVHYEILLGRDEKSLSLGFGGLSGGTANVAVPGHVSDHQQSQGAKYGHHNAQQKGVFSRAIRLKVDDTASLWNNPRLPEWDDQGNARVKEHNADAPVEDVIHNIPKDDDLDEHRDKRQKKVHLVVITHGLHSNLGADMLYLKESIDAAAKQAKADAKVRRAKCRGGEREKASPTEMPHGEHRNAKRENTTGESKAPAEQKEDNRDEDEDEEEIVVRGFSGNAVRTEKGIKYLGKRLAKFILAMTYPDQPYKPIQRTTTQNLAAHVKHDPPKDPSGNPVHSHSTILKQPYKDKKLAYKITSISFIAHSLGGLVQTYAIAYIQKHSPHFFDLIKPINFVALATPFLGLSNENPLYVKFALDFGLVGRTGQDLGLTWRAPTLARSGWGAIVSSIGENAHKKAEKQYDPGSKPLLRILPTGPAHIALKKFRNRTVYANVVNDGIVPLRTSCLLFLDWQGLGRVEKARRENGLVGTVAGWGWAELTGQNARVAARRPWLEEQGNESLDSMDEADTNTPIRQGKGTEVPQPSENEANDADDDARSLKLVQRQPSSAAAEDLLESQTSPTAGATTNSGAFESFLELFRPNTSKSQNHNPKQNKMYKRSQTIKFDNESIVKLGEPKDDASKRKGENAAADDPDSLLAPPQTTFFEAAVDLVNPPLPPVEWLIDPSKRPRTIFHDRVYHPEDIPPPPLKRGSTSSIKRRFSMRSSSTHSLQSQQSSNDGSSPDVVESPRRDAVDGSAMKVEEKIARAYHRDLSWRKVLVRLEPDAHNNLIVRRKFANAYGWPVVKHLVDTHFSDAAVAKLRDEDESNQERAKDSNKRPTMSGNEVKEPGRDDANPHAEDEQDGIKQLQRSDRSNSENLESTDQVPRLNSPGALAQTLHSGKRPAMREREDSAQWSDGDFMDSEDDSDAESSEPKHTKTPRGGWNWTEAVAGKGASSPRLEKEKAMRQKEIDDFLRGKPVVDDQNDHDDHNTLVADAAAARIISEGTGTVGLGRSLSAKSAGNTGVVEQVARLSFGKDHKE
jgi:hypothetical protein